MAMQSGVALCSIRSHAATLRSSLLLFSKSYFTWFEETEAMQRFRLSGAAPPLQLRVAVEPQSSMYNVFI